MFRYKSKIGLEARELVWYCPVTMRWIDRNTFPKANRSSQKDYARHPVITKNTNQKNSSQRVQDAEDGWLVLPGDGRRAVDDGGLRGTGVIYSLNKRQRWRLVDLLRQQIIPSGPSFRVPMETRAERAPDGYHVTVVEMNKTTRPSACRRVLSTNLPHELTPARGRDCFNRESIPGAASGAGRRRNRWRRKKGRNNTPDQNGCSVTTCDVTEFRYEVHYPVPKTHKPRHHPRLTQNGWSPTHEWNCALDSRAAKCHNRKKACNPSPILQVEAGHYEDALDDVSDDVMTWALQESIDDYNMANMACPPNGDQYMNGFICYDESRYVCDDMSDLHVVAATCQINNLHRPKHSTETVQSETVKDDCSFIDLKGWEYEAEPKAEPEVTRAVPRSPSLSSVGTEDDWELLDLPE